MHLTRLLLSALLLLCCCCSLSCLPVCVSRCCKLVENFPSRLRKLRENYRHIQNFYVSWGLFFVFFCDLRREPTFVSVLQEANDDLDTMLLDSSVEVSFTVSPPPHSLVL